MIHLARCCSPVPGDSIMGFITQGRGVSVHRDDCSNAVALAQRLGERIIDVEWDGSAGGQYRAVLEIMAFDRRGSCSTSPKWWPSTTSTSSRAAPRRRERASCAWSSTWSSPTPTHLSSLLAALKGVDGVFDAFRQLPGQNKTS